ncbi:trans-sulfuration enzyme family protein [Taibaiella koreensis]|uniref:trans-sulfuration enzyme family protein n=1 Tax=Taibaiella koreensis TaxID=1268548 RepID=UPI000E59E4E0|nr:PLP-dependent aspartate aminotransferase family protein [Taibaiella koreensis]
MSTTTQILSSIPVDALTGAISVPIYQTATFVQEAPGVNKGYDYSRSGNPTRAALEEVLAGLEGGATGLAFASGLAAIDTVLKLLKSGDEILAVDDIYGGAYRLFTHVYEKFGIHIRYIDTSDVVLVQRSITPATRLIWLESPTNPTLKVSDIKAIASLAKAHGAWLCVDNTFTSPVLQKPLALGADIVVHSATKYLGGHSDLIAGAIVAKDPELGARLKFLQNAAGNVLGPFDSWLVLRGLETLPLRVRQQSQSAWAIAQYLETHEAVAAVYYPGLTSHPNHELASRQQKGFGGVISFRLKQDDQQSATAFLKTLHLFHLAESLGGVKSLCCLPCEMTHKSVPREKRLLTGVTDGFIRLSVGIEETEDLIADLEQAFERLAGNGIEAGIPEHLLATA